MRLNEIDLTITDELIDHHSGQTDSRIVAKSGDNIVGYIDYVDYRGEISISMIKSTITGNGVAKRMLLFLQGLYPKTEINFGYVTDDGKSLYNSLKFNKIKSQHFDEFEELSGLKSKLKYLKTRIDSGLVTGNELTLLYDEFHDLEQVIEDREFELRDVKPFNEIIVG